MNAKLLLVEDDASLGATLQERLLREGYEVIWVTTIGESWQMVQNTQLDLIILDVNLPDGSGFDLARRVREVSPVPFLFMTALNSAENRLEGFELGAEEFVPKPFHLKELILRLAHVLNHHRSLQRIKCGPWWIELASGQLVHESGSRKQLAPRDFRLLRLLIETAPEVVSRDHILDKIWGEDQFPTPRTVDNAIVRLRSELGDSQGQIIRTVRGVGYQWVPQVSDGEQGKTDE